MSHSRPINNSEVKDKAVTPPNNSPEDHDSPVVTLSSSDPEVSNTRRVRKSELTENTAAHNLAPAEEAPHALPPIKENGNHEAATIEDQNIISPTEATDNNPAATEKSRTPSPTHEKIEDVNYFTQFESYFDKRLLIDDEKLIDEALEFAKMLLVMEKHKDSSQAAMNALRNEMTAIIKKNGKLDPLEVSFKSKVGALSLNLDKINADELAAAYRQYISQITEQGVKNDIQCFISNAFNQQNNPFVEMHMYLQTCNPFDKKTNPFKSKVTPERKAEKHDGFIQLLSIPIQEAEPKKQESLSNSASEDPSVTVPVSPIPKEAQAFGEEVMRIAKICMTSKNKVGVFTSQHGGEWAKIMSKFTKGDNAAKGIYFDDFRAYEETLRAQRVYSPFAGKIYGEVAAKREIALAKKTEEMTLLTSLTNASGPQ